MAAGRQPYGLQADGRTVAFYSSGTGTLKIYDLESDTVASTRTRMPADGDIEMVDWTGPGEVTMHVTYNTGDSGKPVTMRIFQIDAQTGDVRLRDTYKVKYAFFAACGG